MNDQSFHEIQLSGKQLVFLFMSAVVLAVAIFLLGVSVGRGVRASVASASAADVGAPTDTTASAAPGGTKVTPADLDYRDKLQGQGGAGAAGAVVGAAAAAASSTAKPAETPAAPPASTPDTAAAKPADTPAAKPPDKKPNLLPMADSPSKSSTPPTPTPTSTPKPTATKPASGNAAPPKPAGNEAAWFVQLNAFSTKGAADGFIKDLKGKGYTASAVSTGALFKVRMGPYADRAEADKMASRLVKDGYKPLVTR